jgi:hypothetical protein
VWLFRAAAFLHCVRRISSAVRSNSFDDGRCLSHQLGINAAIAECTWHSVSSGFFPPEFHSHPRQEQFHDVKENERIGQVQLRKVWANVGAFNLGLWVNSLVELWAWKRGKASLVDRGESPWDDAERRASHGDWRKALQHELLDSEFQRHGVSGPGSRKIRKLFQAVVKLVA